MQLSSSQLGINIHLAGIKQFDLDEGKTVKQLLELPYQHVRIPIPLSEVSPQKNKWDFSKRDWLIELASKHKKSLHLQTGAKTIGWPEVWLPTWLIEKHPYLSKPHAHIDNHPEVAEFLLEAIERVGEKYFGLENLQSIQIENEAFCKRLSVSNYRYISFPFHTKELEVVKKHNSSKALILQNLPLNHLLDMIQAFPYLLKTCDVLGLNIYNQHIPYKPYQLANDVFLSNTTKIAKALVSLQQKQLYVTEIQTAAWLTGNNTPIKPFSEKLFEKTIKQYVNLGASIIFLWDVEQIIWQNDKRHLATLMTLTA